MLDALFGSYSNLGLNILRIGLAVVFFAHGLMKLRGMDNTIGFFKQLGIPLPEVNAWFVALLETGGAILLVLGLGTRILAILFVFDMLVAILTARIRMMKSPFVGGWELEFGLLMGSLAVFFTGPEMYSLDALLHIGL